MGATEARINGDVPADVAIDPAKFESPIKALRPVEMKRLAAGLEDEREG